MTQKKIAANLLISLSVMLVSACSPYIYKAEVSKFNSGIEEASKMLSSQEVFLSKKSLEINRGDLLDSGSPRLSISDGCTDAVICMEAASDSPQSGSICAEKIRAPSSLEAKDKDPYKLAYKAAVESCGIKAKGGIQVENSMHLTMQKKALSALSSYSGSLAGIVGAEDKNALSESALKACSSTKKLYSAVSNVEPGNKEKNSKELEVEEKAITTICGLATEIGVTIIDRQRLNILTHVVNEADSQVVLLSKYLAGESRKINSVILRSELELLVNSVTATVGLKGKDNEYLASVDSAILQKNKFVSALKANPEDVFLHMAEAHNTLKLAINDSKTQLDISMDSIERFYQAAKEAHEAVEALSEKNLK